MLCQQPSSRRQFIVLPLHAMPHAQSDAIVVVVMSEVYSHLQIFNVCGESVNTDVAVGGGTGGIRNPAILAAK